MSFEAKLITFYVSLILLLGVVLYLGSCKNTPTNTPTNTGWVISNDLTVQSKLGKLMIDFVSLGTVGSLFMN
jgi:hypothetical protein